MAPLVKLWCWNSRVPRSNPPSDAVFSDVCLTVNALFAVAIPSRAKGVKIMSYRVAVSTKKRFSEWNLLSKTILSILRTGNETQYDFTGDSIGCKGWVEVHLTLIPNRQLLRRCQQASTNSIKKGRVRYWLKVTECGEERHKWKGRKKIGGKIRSFVDDGGKQSLVEDRETWSSVFKYLQDSFL